MKATVNIKIFLNATKVVRINNPNPQLKLRIRILPWSKNVAGFRIAIPNLNVLTSFNIEV